MSQQPYLTWISNSDLEKAVERVYLVMQSAMNATSLEKLQSNVVDPFSLIFETHMTGTTVRDWLKAEAQRQAQKSLMNAIGYFHQEVLGSINGWENLDRGHPTGMDIKNQSGTMFAEIKNKYNTLNDSSETNTYNAMLEIANSNLSATVYLVHIIRSRKFPYDEPWKFKTSTLNNRIRKISGENFYQLVTGDKDAIFDLYNVLPQVITKITQAQGKLSPSNSTAFQELQQNVPSATELDFRKYFMDTAFPNT